MAWWGWAIIVLVLIGLIKVRVWNKLYTHKEEQNIDEDLEN